MKFFHYLSVLMLLWSSWALAEPPGTCWSSTVVVVDVTASFSSGKAGSKAHFSYKDPNGANTMSSTCTSVLSGNSVYLSHYRTQFTPNIFVSGDGVMLNSYVKLTNFMVNVWPDNNDTEVPFADHVSGVGSCSNHLCVNTGDGSPYTMSVYRSIWKFSGDLVLTKDVLSGVVVVPPSPIMQSFYSTSSTFASQPEQVFTLNLAPIPVAVSCNINGGQQINVAFGHIQSTDIANTAAMSQARKTQAIDIDCTSSLNQDVQISYNGTPASFSYDVLNTSSADIGIEMLHDETVVPPGGNFELHLDDGKASTSVTFVVVKDPNVTSLKGGDFTASATLILTSD